MAIKKEYGYTRNNRFSTLRALENHLNSDDYTDEDRSNMVGDVVWVFYLHLYYTRSEVYGELHMKEGQIKIMKILMRNSATRRR